MSSSSGYSKYAFGRSQPPIHSDSEESSDDDSHHVDIGELPDLRLSSSSSSSSSSSAAAAAAAILFTEHELCFKWLDQVKTITPAMIDQFRQIFGANSDSSLQTPCTLWEILMDLRTHLLDPEYDDDEEKQATVTALKTSFLTHLLDAFRLATKTKKEEDDEESGKKFSTKNLRGNTPDTRFLWWMLAPCKAITNPVTGQQNSFASYCTQWSNYTNEVFGRLHVWWSTWFQNTPHHQRKTENELSFALYVTDEREDLVMALTEVKWVNKLAGLLPEILQRKNGCLPHSWEYRRPMSSFLAPMSTWMVAKEKDKASKDPETKEIHRRRKEPASADEPAPVPKKSKASTAATAFATTIPWSFELFSQWTPEQRAEELVKAEEEAKVVNDRVGMLKQFNESYEAFQSKWKL